MRVPKLLTGEAAEFWKRNAPDMMADGRLTDATRDGFVLLCLNWGRYLDAERTGADPIKVVALAKQVQNGMRTYAMTPESRRRMKLDHEADISDVLSGLMNQPNQQGKGKGTKT